MKKLFFAAVAVLAFGFTNAQETKFGAKAGLNLSNLTGDAEGNSMKVGFQVGGFAEIKISEKFAIQPELVYSAQGAKFEEEFFGETFEFDLNLGYINVPVLAKYYVAEKFSLEAGPQVGFLISAKAKGEGESEDVKEDFNTLDFGFNLGAGFDVSENINLSLRYTAGLSNIAKDSGDQKVGNNNIAFAVGYRF
jgi:long-subunit fatty acid transport protein